MDKKISGRIFGGRTRLADALPLPTPYILNMFPIYACNLSCEFCLHSLKKESHPFVSDKISMSFELYEKFIDGLRYFPSKIKSIYFAGWGEPLLHPNIADMVSYAVKSGYADRINILTNGIALTPRVSEALVSAGVTLIRVSINGLSTQDYIRNCNQKVDFDSLVDNIKYFASIKKENMLLYVKTIDYLVETDEKKGLFYEIFDPFCDMMQIEGLTPTGQGVDITGLRKGHQLQTTIVGEQLIERNVCPNSFFETCVNPDGKIVPCAYFPYPEIMGDINKDSLYAIWNGDTYRTFRRNMLDGYQNCRNPVCKNCDLFNYRNAAEDVLDHDVERLKALYEINADL